MAMQRLACNSVTEALMQAMERADDIDHIVILYEKKKEVEEDCPYGMFLDGQTDLRTMNYMLDVCKQWIFGE
jgi:hypothetical protein